MTLTPDESSALLAFVARQLQRPLRDLAVASEALAENTPLLRPQEISELVQRVHEKAVVLQALVENVLCDAAVRTGRFALVPRLVDLVDVVEEVRPMVEPVLRQRGQHVRVRAQPDLPRVRADGRRLAQALVNLVLNAGKFGAPGSAVEVDVARARRGAVVRLTVADRGPGLPNGLPMPSADTVGVNEVATPDAPNGLGVGLGLAVVRAIVEAHGGDVGAANRRGGGARVWIDLPAEPKDPDR